VTNQQRQGWTDRIFAAVEMRKADVLVTPGWWKWGSAPATRSLSDHLHIPIGARAQHSF